MKAADEIRLVRENLALAIALWRSAKNGKVNPAELLGSALAHNDSGRSQGAVDREMTERLTRCTANQIRASFALSALQTHRSLDSVFSGEPLDEETPGLQAARCAIFLLNTALARNMFSPVWNCPPRYRRVFEVQPVRFVLDATNAHGQALSWADFGGLERYLFLLDYCTIWAESPAAGRPVEERSEGQEAAAASKPHESKPHESKLPESKPQEPKPHESKLRESKLHESYETRSPALAGGAAWNGGAANGVPEAQAPPAGSPRVGPAAGSVPEVVADPVGLFISARCEIGEGFRSMAKDLYASYVDWCVDTERRPGPQRNFGMRLTSMGLERRRRGRGKHWWEGIALAATAEPTLAGRRNGER